MRRAGVLSLDWRMTPDRIVLIGCAALLVVSVFADTRGAGQVSPKTHVEPTWAKQAPSVSAPTTDTWNAQEATEALVTLKNEGCIIWREPLSERDLMTCGETIPAVKIVSYERRYVQ